MNTVYNFSLFLVLVAIVSATIAVVRPKTFKSFFGRFATRPKLILIFFLVIVALGAVVSATEPASVKLERAAKERQQQEQRLKDQELKEKAQAVAQKPKVETVKQPAAKSAEQLVKEAAEKTAKDKQRKRNYWHKVTQVVDGDTVKAMVDGEVESIRIIGIDAPETAECYYDKSSAKAKELLSGKWLQLEVDDSQGARDKYGRLLAYVWFGQQTDFGKLMVEQGFAYEYTYTSAYSKQAQYKQAETNAKSKKSGLWATDTCNGKKQKPVVAAPAPAPKAAPTPAPVVTPAPSSNCDPNYTPCIPYVTGNSLNCPDIQVMVHVIGTDHNKFDANGDGYGCESYQ